MITVTATNVVPVLTDVSTGRPLVTTQVTILMDVCPHHTDQSENITSFAPFRIDYGHPPDYITRFVPA